MRTSKVQSEAGAAAQREGAIKKRLRQHARQILDSREKGAQKEDELVALLRCDLGKVGEFYRTPEGGALFFRYSDRRLYDLTTTVVSPFGEFVTWMTDLSVSAAVARRSLERLRARVGQEAETVQVHGLAYNSPDAGIITINDFGGGMWYRERGNHWEYKPNGHTGILFWTPSVLVEPWTPEFSANPAIRDEDHLQWFLEQPHFADDLLTARDQRQLLRVLILSFFFPALNETRPVQAHLGVSQQRQRDTGKTMTAKMIGTQLTGRKFQPTPLDSRHGEEALGLALMHHPFVVADNVDTDIPWLNDFLCLYATGTRPMRRKLYTDSTLAYIEFRGRLAVTSRKPKFNRADTASRTLPFRFAPIADTERKTEPELLGPILERRGRVWAGLLQAIALLQDALPGLSPPSPSLRLADFEQFGWRVAAVLGEQEDWQATMRRLKAAQAGFVLDDEPLLPILSMMLQTGDVPDQKTGDFYTEVRRVAETLGLGLEVPMNASALTKQLNEVKDFLEVQLDASIYLRTLHGQTMIRILRGRTRATSDTGGGGRGDRASLPSVEKRG